MKRVFLVIVALLTFCSSGIIVHFYYREDDLSLRYILWKKGLHPYPSDIIWRAINSDTNLNELIQGKSKAEIQRIFFNEKLHQESINNYQKMYDRELKGREYLWVGDSAEIIFLENGNGHYISLMKG